MPKRYRSEEEYQAAVEAEARLIWDKQQEPFPAFTKQRWDEGTSLARARCLHFAAENLRK